MDTASGLQFLRAVGPVLDLPPGLQRLVIVADVREPLRVYVKAVAPLEAIPAIVQAVKDVRVTDTADVTVTPFGVPAG